MPEQLHLPYIAPPMERENTAPNRRSLIGKKGVMQSRALLQDIGVTTIEAPELEPYDFSADIETKQNINFIIKVQVKAREIPGGSYSFKKGNGKPYSPGDFHINACGLLSTRLCIFAAGIPTKTIRYNPQYFLNEEYCKSSWDAAVQIYLDTLTKQLNSNKELTYVRH